MRIVIAFIMLFSASLHSDNAFSAFSEGEAKQVCHILHHLFKFDHFSYTLFGDKPISFECLNCKSEDYIDYTMWLTHQKPDDQLESSWAIWQSKFSDFESDSYLLFEKRNAGKAIVVFVNKKAFSETFNLNKEIFQKVMGMDVTPAILLERIKSNEHSLESALANNQELFGILLGFGSHSSKLFKIKSDIYHNHILDSQFRNAQLSEFDQLLNGSYINFHSIFVVQPMQFCIAPDHDEAKLLLQKYARVQLEASLLLRDVNFVDVIISKLREGHAGNCVK